MFWYITMYTPLNQKTEHHKCVKLIQVQSLLRII